MSKRIAIFGGTFSPPGLHHLRIVEQVAREFDEVCIVPCGPRPDKVTAHEVDPIHRATMADLAFRNHGRVRVDLFDLESEAFTRTVALQERYGTEADVWFVVGSDLVEGGSQGKSEIQREWHRGEEVWQTCRFAVVQRARHCVAETDLPPLGRLIGTPVEGSSSELRERIYRRMPLEGLISQEVREHIERYGLYRGGIPGKTSQLSLETPRALTIVDDPNDRARTLCQRFAAIPDHDDPNVIVVIGGDGTMLHTIRKLWRMRLPFLGLNAGHRGFLLNTMSEHWDLPSYFQNLTLHQLPLLYVECQDLAGAWRNTLAFNDAWVERQTGQAAWLEVRVNDQCRLPKLVGDGALVSTAAGSTAYARAMGATPLLVDAQILLLAGSNVSEPPNWNSANLPLDSVVSITTLDPEKRPIKAFVDGVPQGEVRAIRARVSRIAAAELAFAPRQDLSEKLARIQFPQYQ